VAKSLKRLKANRVHKFQRILSLHKQMNADGTSPATYIRSASLTRQLSDRTKEFFSPPAQSVASSTSSDRTTTRTPLTGFRRSFRAASKKFFSPHHAAQQQQQQQQQQPTDEQASYPATVVAESAEVLAAAAWAEEDRIQQLANAPPRSAMAGQRSQSVNHAALKPALKTIDSPARRPPAGDNHADNVAVADPAAPVGSSAMAKRRSVSFGGLLRRASIGLLRPPPPAAVPVAVPEEPATAGADDAQGDDEQLALDGDAEKLTVDDGTSARAL